PWTRIGLPTPVTRTPGRGIDSSERPLKGRENLLIGWARLGWRPVLEWAGTATHWSTRTLARNLDRPRRRSAGSRVHSSLAQTASHASTGLEMALSEEPITE